MRRDIPEMGFLDKARVRDAEMGFLDKNGNTVLPIKVKYIRSILPLEIFESGDWIDLRCGETISMRKGEYRLIPLGIAMELPDGYEAEVAPRSSTFGRYGILMVNSIGVIDESYNGDGDEWRFPALAMRDTTIEKNSRIAQFRIRRHQPAIVLVSVENLGNDDRGGIGSTGKI